MRDDLEDVLVPVIWAKAQIPIFQDRLLTWQRSYPYEIVAEPDPDHPNRELLTAYLKKPLDPLIIGDIGAAINSIRTGLDLLRYGVLPMCRLPFANASKVAGFIKERRRDLARKPPEPAMWPVIVIGLAAVWQC
jgi:hypothetical protein